MHLKLGLVTSSENVPDFNITNLHFLVLGGLPSYVLSTFIIHNIGLHSSHLKEGSEFSLIYDYFYRSLLSFCFFKRIVYSVYLFIYLFIFGCVGSSFLCEGFL